MYRKLFKNLVVSLDFLGVADIDAAAETGVIRQGDVIVIAYNVYLID